MKEIKHRFKDYFDLLNVDKNSTKEDVQKAFMNKASVWHPDKAENDEDREYYTKMYQDLQAAYKILSNDNSRRQYIDSQQTTDIEFKNMERDLGYGTTTQFKKDDGKFDADAFTAAFDQSRDEYDAGLLDELTKKYATPAKVTDNEYQDLLARREQEQQEIAQPHVFNSTDFDANVFNRAFDFMKTSQPGNGVQLYEGLPRSMFSSNGLQECDMISAVNFGNGTTFTAQNMDNLILGQSVNPQLGYLDLKELDTGIDYGREDKMSTEDMMKRINSMQSDRDQLANMSRDQYIVEPTEIETLYADLFAPVDVEGLEAPKLVQSKPVPVSTEQSKPTKIREKIDLKKHASAITLTPTRLEKKVHVQIKSKQSEKSEKSEPESKSEWSKSKSESEKNDL
jgi:curved DNA-binding protein CbpA